MGIKTWCTKRMIEILSHDDDVISSLIDGYLNKRNLNIKEIHSNLIGLLKNHTDIFVTELFSNLVSAQQNYRNKNKKKTGIPKQIMDEKRAKRRYKYEFLQNSKLHLITNVIQNVK